MKSLSTFSWDGAHLHGYWFSQRQKQTGITSKGPFGYSPIESESMTGPELVQENLRFENSSSSGLRATILQLGQVILVCILSLLPSNIFVLSKARIRLHYYRFISIHNITGWELLLATPLWAYFPGKVLMHERYLNLSQDPCEHWGYCPDSQLIGWIYGNNDEMTGLLIVTFGTPWPLGRCKALDGLGSRKVCASTWAISFFNLAKSKIEILQLRFDPTIEPKFSAFSARGVAQNDGSRRGIADYIYQMLKELQTNHIFLWMKFLIQFLRVKRDTSKREPFLCSTLCRVY